MRPFTSLLPHSPKLSDAPSDCWISSALRISLSTGRTHTQKRINTLPCFSHLLTLCSPPHFPFLIRFKEFPKSWYFTGIGVFLLEVAVHASANSPTVSACALSACCVHIICRFGLTFTCVPGKSCLHCKTDWVIV